MDGTPPRQEGATVGGVAKWKEVALFIQSILTSAALIAGGLWFYWQREVYPHAQITHTITHRFIDHGLVWVHLGLTIQNVGHSALAIEKIKVRVDQVLPLDPQISDAVASGSPLVDSEEHRVPWPPIAGPYTDDSV